MRHAALYNALPFRQNGRWNRWKMSVRSLPVLTNCEVCQSKSLFNVLDLGDHPLCDDLIPLGSSEKSLLYPIVIDFCPRCRTAFQRYQVKKEILFPSSYHYRARMTPS